jgi:hypothetical protein
MVLEAIVMFLALMAKILAALKKIRMMMGGIRARLTSPHVLKNVSRVL